MDRIKRFLPLILLAGVIALIFAMGWNRYLSLDTLRDHGEGFREFTARNYLVSLLILMTLFAAFVDPAIRLTNDKASLFDKSWTTGVLPYFQNCGRYSR